jgi:fructose-1,6-bisphosphatase/inositol monophosphatase family enzyme
VNYSEYLNFAKKLAKQSGRTMLEYFKIGLDHSLKADGSHLSMVDEKINSSVISAIRQKYSEHSILAEEGSFTVEGSQMTWVCDPIDGTFHFVSGVPTFTFMLALLKDGDPVLAVIYDPSTDRMYHAVKKSGAFMNDQPIHVNDKFDLSTGRSAFPGFSADLLDVAHLHLDAITSGVKTFAFGCVSYEGLLVATGQTAANIFPLDTPWDGAALKLIVEEAGGRVTNLRGEDQRYDRPTYGLVVSNGRVHDELVRLIHPHLRPEVSSA